MSLKYIYQSDQSQLRMDPLTDSTDFYEGEFVTRTDAGEIRRFDPANDALPTGIVPHHVGPLSDVLAEHDEDYTTYEELYHFQGSEGDRAYYLPLDSGATIMPQTITDEQDANGNTPPEPTVGDGTPVGILTGPSGETRIVEQGYQYDVDDDGTQETFSESGAGDFVALGRIYQQPQHTRLEDNYDQRIPVRLTPELFQP